MNASRKALFVAIGLVVTAVATFVIIGMIRGANPQFEKGRSPLTTVVIQELFGALTLVTLATVARQLPALARGKSLARPLAWLAGAAALAIVWAFALMSERAS